MRTTPVAKDTQTRIHFPTPRLYSARFEGDVIFSTADGLLRITGPPISINAFRLDSDEPQWNSVPPEEIDLNLQRLVKLAETKEMNRVVRDARWLIKLVGDDLMSTACVLPRTARPYLLIWLAHRVPSFHDLLVDATMLAICLADFRLRHISSQEELLAAIREDAHQPRRTLMTTLNLPKSARRSFNRIHPTAANPRRLAALRRSLRHPRLLKIWQHLPIISRDTFRMFVNPRIADRLGNGFLHHAAQMDPTGHGMGLYEIFQDLLTLERRAGWVIPAGIFEHPGRLLEWHSKLPSYPRRRELHQLLKKQFPQSPLNPPPRPPEELHPGVRGTGTIQQITSGEALAREAFELRHCVINYANSMSYGMSYVYAVDPGEGFERCTMRLALRLDQDGRRTLKLAEVRGKQNAVVSPSVLANLKAWLHESLRGVRIE